MAGIGRKWPFIDMAHDTFARDNRANIFIRVYSHGGIPPCPHVIRCHLYSTTMYDKPLMVWHAANDC